MIQLKLAYAQGSEQALQTLGLHTTSADAFTQQVQQMDELVDSPQAARSNTDKPVHWGSSVSLEGGDVGTRNYEMGVR